MTADEICSEVEKISLKKTEAYASVFYSAEAAF